MEETRNLMQTCSWKKCSHFSPTNFHLHFHMKSPSVFLIILLIKAKHNMLIATILSYICLVLKRDNGSIVGVVDVLLDLIRL